MSKTSRDRKKRSKDLQGFVVVLKVPSEVGVETIVLKAKDMATAIRTAEARHPNARVINVTKL